MTNDETGITHPRTERRAQLYDLLSDPHEEHNLAAQHPDVVQRLADAIANNVRLPIPAYLRTTCSTQSLNCSTAG